MTQDENTIWWTEFMWTPENRFSAGWECEGKGIDYVRAYRERKPPPDHGYPLHLTTDQPYPSPDDKAPTPDFFKITDGLGVVTQRFHDVLKNFDLGDTHMIELPMYSHGHDAALPEKFYVLYVIKRDESFFIPEKSEKTRRAPLLGDPVWKPPCDDGTVALRDGADVGIDLWADPILLGCVFVSDRLKRAMKAAKIKMKSFNPHPCLIVTQNT